MRFKSFTCGGQYMNKIYKAYYDSPLGIIEIKGTEQGILAISFDEEGLVQEVPAVLEECYEQLGEYFKGQRKEFALNLIFEGTDFQKKVWLELTKVPFGNTASYKDIAEGIGNVKAMRAVGNANSKNPFSIVVPCHRVIGANGNLVGYAGGLWRKKWLLNHENK